MSSWFSDRALRVIALSAVAGMAAAAVAFHLFQNGLGLTGGAVAPAKSAWLALALTFWFVLPALMVCDGRIAPAFRMPFAALLFLMGLRGVAELWMLYVSHNWSPSYGIAHDLVCMGVTWWLAARAAAPVRPSRLAAIDRTALVHAIATGLLFIPEMYFAWYMQAHFLTHGDQPIYFVPDGEVHARVLAITAGADVAAALYLPAFLYAWLHGKTDLARS